MVNMEAFQQRGKEQYDAVIASAGSVTKGVQAIATAYADYSKKSFEESKSFVEKLAGVKSLEKAIELQTEYAKTAYELFMAEMAKIAELYKDLAKETYKPLTSLVAKSAAPATN
jgi:phasin family protein